MSWLFPVNDVAGPGEPALCVHKASTQSGRATCRRLLCHPHQSWHCPSLFLSPKAWSRLYLTLTGQLSKYSSTQSPVHVSPWRAHTGPERRLLPPLQLKAQRLREGKALAQRHPGWRLQARFEPLSPYKAFPTMSCCPFPNSFWVAIKNRTKYLTTQWSPALRLGQWQHEGI